MLKKKFLPAVLLSVCTLTAGIALSGCGPSAPPETLKYTVTFDTNGGSTIAPIEVDKNKRVTKPADPTRGTDEFQGWYTDNNTFLTPWNFDVNIVTKDTTLYANWLSVYNYPSEVGLDASSPFSSKLVWKQKDVSQSTTTFTVSVGDVEKSGTWTYDQSSKTVTYTFDEAINGGAQSVKIQTTRTDTSDPIQDATASIKFKGTGTEANPYRIYADTTTDLLAVTNGTFDSQDKFFKLEEDITFQSNIDDKNNAIFKGTFDGNDKRILFSGTTNGGVFYEIAEGATFKNTKFEGTVSTTKSLFAPVASHNKGTVDNIYTLMQIVSEVGEIGTAFSGNIADLANFVGGASGVVGVNHSTGVIKNSEMKSDSSSNTLKVANGGGGMASINYGTITGCEMQACIGAYNAKEVGKSNAKYSFLGGIAGYNYGTIEYCEIAGTGKILAQRYQDNSTASNIAIGGMAGLNGATGVIKNCSNEALRVHGDHYVGGIAGINAGIITTCEVGFALKSNDQITYVGGRNWVGGIAGKIEGTGTVSNCLFAGNVYAHNTTTNETKQFAIAESATNSVYVDHNLDTVKTASSGDVGTVPTESALTAPQGTNNIAIEVGDGTLAQTANYVIPENEALLTALNTGLESSRFIFTDGIGIRLDMTIPTQS
ncbi:MAG: InlB B-repeat-containing protein [Clostridia bacterium]|nr:InlB B-repeat-containing protein [Clostridia bacterium]